MMPDVKRLVEAARRAAFKMKREYDRLQPDAGADECWAEQERLVQALSDFDRIYRPTAEQVRRAAFNAGKDWVES